MHDQAARETSPSDVTRASRPALQAIWPMPWNAAPDKPGGSANWKSHVLGDNAWRESGLGAPTDVDPAPNELSTRSLWPSVETYRISSLIARETIGQVR